MCVGQACKTQQQQNKNANISILARARDRTQDLSHRSLLRYIWTIEALKRIVCSEVV